jgi:hypothetical protein
VGRQYLLFGFEGSGWIGRGTLYHELDGGSRGAKIGDYTDYALGLGPVFTGFNHVVSRNVHFEIRLGMGTTTFFNDRLLSKELSGEGKVHVAFVYGIELLGRYVTESGLTLSMGGNMGGVTLPDDTGALLRASPRLGYLMWDKGFEGFTLVELGYQFPVINGLQPEFTGVLSDPPLESVWHVVNASILWAF